MTAKLNMATLQRIEIQPPARSAPYRVLRFFYRTAKHWSRVSSVKVQSFSCRKLIIGAGPDPTPDWISTNIDTLNILRDGDWSFYFAPNRLNAILAEHVWEHLKPEEGHIAAGFCFKYLRPGGYLRIAVPDGFQPSKSYIEDVRPGGRGLGADDHKILYDHVQMSRMLSSVGFQIRLLEYFDESGTFHEQPWKQEDGRVDRCKTDERNKDGKLNYTSLIVDAVKP